MTYRSLRVLEIAKSTGGVGEYMRWLANGIDKQRFQLTVACLSEGGSALAAELGAIEGVKAFSVAMNRYKIDPFSDSRALFALARMIRRERFDLIHVHASKPGYLGRLATMGTAIPIIYSPHCFSFHDGTGRLKAQAFALLERIAARHLTTQIITVCDGERDMALKWQIGEPDLFRTVHTGIDPSPFALKVDRAAVRKSLGVPVDAPLIGTVGRLSKQKAPVDFVRTAALVHKQRPDAHFVWVGDGQLADEMRILIAEQGLEHVCHMVGLRRDVHAVLNVLDLFVLTSHWEGFSLSILEAMATGLPIVSTYVTGADEAIIHGENGLIVPIGAVEELAQAILDLLHDPAKAQQFATASRARIDQYFTRTRMISQLAQTYEDVHTNYQQKVAAQPGFTA